MQPGWAKGERAHQACPVCGLCRAGWVRGISSGAPLLLPQSPGVLHPVRLREALPAGLGPSSELGMGQGLPGLGRAASAGTGAQPELWHRRAASQSLQLRVKYGSMMTAVVCAREPGHTPSSTCGPTSGCVQEAGDSQMCLGHLRSTVSVRLFV